MVRYVVTPSPNSLSLGWNLMLLMMLALGLSACAQVVAPLSPADPRLPSEAKQRIADAEDAVIIARGHGQDAAQSLSSAQKRVADFESRPPKLGAALDTARQLNSVRLSLAELERDYSQVEISLSEARLALVYAQTSLRYDLAVYDLTPLTQQVDQLRSKLLNLRSARKGLNAELKKLRDSWWTAYQALARGAGTQPYWVHEFGR